MKNKAVFLDRDGVLNQAVVRNGKPYPPASAAELVLAPDALAALRELKAEGFLLLVVTNQPDVAKGITTRAAVEEINRKLASTLPVDDVFVCYHQDKDDCDCRMRKRFNKKEGASPVNSLVRISNRVRLRRQVAAMDPRVQGSEDRVRSLSTNCKTRR